MASGSLVECELEEKDERGKPSPFLESNNTSLLLMEVNGCVHPGLKSVRDFLHGVDHGGNLNI